jgi:hypothetical protein
VCVIKYIVQLHLTRVGYSCVHGAVIGCSGTANSTGIHTMWSHRVVKHPRREQLPGRKHPLEDRPTATCYPLDLSPRSRSSICRGGEGSIYTETLCRTLFQRIASSNGPPERRRPSDGPERPPPVEGPRPPRSQCHSQPRRRKRDGDYSSIAKVSGQPITLTLGLALIIHPLLAPSRGLGLSGVRILLQLTSTRLM